MARRRSINSCVKQDVENLIAIKTTEYEALLKKQEILDTLMSLGLEDWESYNFALDMIDEKKEVDNPA